MYVIPVAMIAGYLPVDISAFLFNLLFVTIGNILGGAVFVALVYWFIYLYPGKK
jgi:formate transporter